MDQRSFEASLTNVTREFDAYFTRMGKPNWKTAPPMQVLGIFYSTTEGGYYQYFPPMCAADASLPSWQCIGLTFEDAVRYLT